MLHYASQAPARPVSVGIVEGNDALGADLRRVFDASPASRCVGVWNSAREGLQQIDALRPEMVLLNTNLPGMPVDRATALIHRFLPETRIIIISENHDTARINAALEAGACGYLTTPPAAREPSGMAHAIAAIASGVLGALETHASGAKPVHGGTPLSSKEKSVARLISEGLTNKEIAARLRIQPSTVHSHMKSIFAKLRVRSRTEVAVKYVETLKTAAG